MSDPRLGIVHDPLQDGISELSLVNRMGNDWMVLNCARISYANDDIMKELGLTVDILESDYKLLKFLITKLHSSPFYHPQLSFVVKKPIFVARQWMRHNVGIAYNELSARYIQFGKKIPLEFYLPNNFRAQHETNRQASAGNLPEKENVLCKEAANRAYRVASLEYFNILELGGAKEQARMVLPVATYTKVRMTGSLWACLNFLRLRAKPDAQWEIQQYAYVMQEMLRPYFPTTMQIIQEIAESKNV